MVYNRYIRNDQGVYTRIPEPEASGNPPQKVPGGATAIPVIPQHEQEKQEACMEAFFQPPSDQIIGQPRELSLRIVLIVRVHGRSPC